MLWFQVRVLVGPPSLSPGAAWNCTGTELPVFARGRRPLAMEANSRLCAQNNNKVVVLCIWLNGVEMRRVGSST
jgi:hypothetical protein